VQSREQVPSNEAEQQTMINHVPIALAKTTPINQNMFLPHKLHHEEHIQRSYLEKRKSP
jgi:hypothetical protein